MRALPFILAAASGLVLPVAAVAEPQVAYDGGRLSLEASAEPLDVVLGAVGAAAGLEVPVLGEAGGTYSGQLRAVPLADALRRILGARSFMLQYRPDGSPERLVVLGAASAPAAKPSPEVEAPPVAAYVDIPSPDEEERFVVERLTARDLGARVVGVRRLGRLPPERVAAIATPLVGSEREPVVRAELATTLGQAGGPASVPLLERLLGDPDPIVRRAALDALATRDEPAAGEQLRRVAARASDPLAPAAARLLACAGQANCSVD